MHAKCEAAKGEKDTEMSSKQTMKMRDDRQSVLFMALTLAPLRIYNLHLQPFTITNKCIAIAYFPFSASLLPCAMPTFATGFIVLLFWIELCSSACDVKFRGKQSWEEGEIAKCTLFYSHKKHKRECGGEWNCAAMTVGTTAERSLFPGERDGRLEREIAQTRSSRLIGRPIELRHLSLTVT